MIIFLFLVLQIFLMSKSYHILMHTIGCETAFCRTHDRLTELVRVRRYISGSIESLHGCLLSLVDDEASLGILLRRHAVDDRRKRCRSDGDEYSIEGEDIAFGR